MAASASETLLVIGISQGSDHLSFHVTTTDSTPGTEQLLVVVTAVVAPVLAEEPTLSQSPAALFAFEAAYMEVEVFHFQYFARTFFPAASTKYLSFLVDSCS